LRIAAAVLQGQAVPVAAVVVEEEAVLLLLAEGDALVQGIHRPSVDAERDQALPWGDALWRALACRGVGKLSVAL